MEQKKYWQNFGELRNSNAYQESLGNEFEEELPSGEADDKGILDARSPRRDFLKYLGFSTAAAAVAASCEMPVKKSIPFLNKPESIIPGVANYYATTFVQDGEAIPILAKVRDGRPIKIEGNDASTMTRGGTGAIAQASVLDLYDTARLRFPLGDSKEVTTFEAFDKMVSEALAGLGSSPVVLLTSTVTSPTTKQIISAFLAKYPGRHVQYDALSASGILQANEASFGRRAIPLYNFKNAKVIVSLGADFLGTWLNALEYSVQYGAGRQINQANPEMSKHIHFESMLSLTGANADDRYVHRPSETGAVALNLLAKLGGAVSAPALTDERLNKGLDMAASMLKAAGSQSLVVSGSNNPDVQLIVNAINAQLGTYGSTISWDGTLNTKQGRDSDMAQLVQDMNSGAVGAVLIHGVNPVYDYFDGKKFGEALKKVKLSISFNDREDETTELVKFVLPDHHYLESWGDAEPKSGFISFLQPTIAPLFKTRAFQTSLLKWSGNNTEYGDYVKAYWVNRLGGLEAWDTALQKGLIEIPGSGTATLSFIGSIADAAGRLAGAKKGGKAELVIYSKISMGSGKSANNPWLQEMPDPITKATWDNYAVISYAMAKELGIKVDDNYEVEMDKPVIRLTVAGKEPVVLPVLVVPGMNANTIAVATGYGRSEKTGRAAANVGRNVFPLVSLSGSHFEYGAADIAYEKLPETFKLAYTQTHNQYEGRVEVVREYALKDFKAKPKALADVRQKLVTDYAKDSADYRGEGTLYPNYPYPGVKWGMSIDLNSCFGCGACTIACTAENNVPVVGKSEIMRAHEMHWLRIDRYFATYRDDSGNDNLDDLNVVFMPMLCQHCDNAPCENVCPVNATNHSSEGLNQMTYNRCIGTRYCANNCPYKVRRFNWADYMGADSFPDNQNHMMDDSVLMMNDDLTRMVLNPDVTVRSRGVIEKCSFCVQRLQEGKLVAKKENRPLETGHENKWDVKTACQQACPTNAIVFGNVNDRNSEVYKIRNEEQTNRNYYVLEQLHVLPSVNYLAKIRNTDRHVGVSEDPHHAPAAETKHEAGAESH